jgi:hypothetical protein
MGTILRGRIVMWEDEIPAAIARHPRGLPVRFHETLIESNITDAAPVASPVHTCCS